MSEGWDAAGAAELAAGKLRHLPPQAAGASPECAAFRAPPPFLRAPTAKAVGAKKCLYAKTYKHFIKTI